MVSRIWLFGPRVGKRELGETTRRSDEESSVVYVHQINLMGHVRIWQKIENVKKKTTKISPPTLLHGSIR